MKCLTCKCEFELTKEERRENDYLGFCSEECFLATLKKDEIAKWKKAKKHKHIPFHVGPHGEPPSKGGHQMEIVVRPIPAVEIELCEKRRGRETFSYGCAVCVLPSARFYRQRDRGAAIGLTAEDEANGERDKED